MKRILAAGAVFALVLLGAPSPANAAPAECDTLEVPGFVCVTVDPEGRILDQAQRVIGRTVETIPTASPSTTTLPAPPARTVTATRTATRTVTETATVTAAPTTVTETATPTNTTGRQAPRTSDTLASETAAPNVPVPGPVEAGVDIIPDDPETAAAAGSLFGFFAGILLGIVGLFVAYRRGQISGEKATLKEFLGVIRGEPQPGRHRA